MGRVASALDLAGDAGPHIQSLTPNATTNRGCLLAAAFGEWEHGPIQLGASHLALCNSARPHLRLLCFVDQHWSPLSQRSEVPTLAKNARMRQPQLECCRRGKDGQPPDVKSLSGISSVVRQILTTEEHRVSTEEHSSRGITIQLQSAVMRIALTCPESSSSRFPETS